MLSYQHEYHAGNFADVLKHCCLLEILSSLAQKEKPFTIIDTHAGSSIYSLNDERILKTLEAENGIKKLFQFTRDRQTPLPHSVSLYLEKESPFIQNDSYAGSPELERQFIRENDVLHLVELHPEAHEKLQLNIKNHAEKNQSVHIHKADSFATLNALTPPKIKRGLILCDPEERAVQQPADLFRPVFPVISACCDGYSGRQFREASHKKVQYGSGYPNRGNGVRMPEASDYDCIRKGKKHGEKRRGRDRKGESNHSLQDGSADRIDFISLRLFVHRE